MVPVVGYSSSIIRVTLVAIYRVQAAVIFIAQQTTGDIKRPVYDDDSRKRNT